MSRLCKFLAHNSISGASLAVHGDARATNFFKLEPQAHLFFGSRTYMFWSSRRVCKTDDNSLFNLDFANSRCWLRTVTTGSGFFWLVRNHWRTLLHVLAQSIVDAPAHYSFNVSSYYLNTLTKGSYTVPDTLPDLNTNPGWSEVQFHAGAVGDNAEVREMSISAEGDHAIPLRL